MANIQNMSDEELLAIANGSATFANDHAPTSNDQGISPNDLAGYSNEELMRIANDQEEPQQQDFLASPYGQYREPTPQLPNPQKPESSWGDVARNIGNRFGPGMKSMGGSFMQMSAEAPKRFIDNVYDSIPDIDQTFEEYKAQKEGRKPKSFTALMGLAETPEEVETRHSKIGLATADLATSAPFAAVFRAMVDDPAAKGVEIRKAAQAESSQYQDNVERGSGKYYAGKIADSLLQQGPALALSIATRSPLPMEASAYGMSASDAYGQQRDAGRSPSEAIGPAAISGLAEAGGEMLPIGIILKEGGSIGARIVKSMVAEGLTEMPTQAVQDIVQMSTISPNMTWRDVWQNAKEAGIIGAGSGGIMAAAAHPFVRGQASTSTETAPSNALPSPEKPLMLTDQRSPAEAISMPNEQGDGTIYMPGNPKLPAPEAFPSQEFITDSQGNTARLNEGEAADLSRQRQQAEQQALDSGLTPDVVRAQQMRQPWQMKQEEYTASAGEEAGNHNEMVAQALLGGEDVPAEVIREYPDLKKQTDTLIKTIEDVTNPERDNTGQRAAATPERTYLENSLASQGLIKEEGGKLTVTDEGKAYVEKLKNAQQKLQETLSPNLMLPPAKNEKPTSAALADLQDAGEKIGGARKDLWKSRGLAPADIEGMSEGEAFSLVKKDNVWPKPDYRTMVESGMNPLLARAIKHVRDNLAPAPRYDSPAARKAYLEVVGAMREAAKTAQTLDDVVAMGKIPHKYYKAIEEQHGGMWHKDKDLSHAVFSVGDKLNKTTIGNYDLLKIRDEVAKKNWPFIERKAGETTRSPRPERPHLDKLERTGKDYLQGRNMTSENFINEFGFRGVEFGNWTASDERQRMVNMAYEALMDTADILNVDPKVLSLDGTLGIAFGARGKSNANAHYEPAKRVINLTKIKGAGALAHEWGHALDHYLGELDTKREGKGSTLMATEQRALPNLRPEVEDALRSIKEAMDIRKLNRDESAQKMQQSIDQIDNDIAKAKERMERYRGNDAQNEYVKSLESYIKGLEEKKARETNALKEVQEGGNVPVKYASQKSDFRKNAEELDKTRSKPYYSTRAEMFARTFESYVNDKVKAQKNKSDYLVHSTDSSIYSVLYGNNPYPEGQERSAINQAYDELFSTLRTRDGKNGMPTFYSNPFFDPKVWKMLYEDTLKPLFGWTAKQAHEWKQNWETTTSLYSDGKSKRTNPLEVMRFAGNILFRSEDGLMASLTARYKSPTIQAIKDMLFAEGGVNRAIGTSYQEATERRIKTNLNKLGRILEPFGRGKESRDKISRIVNLIENPEKIKAGRSQVDNAAIAISRLLTEERNYMLQSGLDVGLVEGGYFPAMYDTQAIIDDPAGFLDAATVAYERTYKTISKAAARDMAEAWLHNIRLGDVFVSSKNNDFTSFAGSAPKPNSMKERVFTKEARDILRDKGYTITDPVTALQMHFARTAPKAEFNRRFSPEQWAVMKERMIQEGAAAAIPHVVKIIKSSTGNAGFDVHPMVRKVESYARLTSILEFLPRATIASLHESSMAAVSTGSARAAVRAFNTTFKELFHASSNDEIRAISEDIIGTSGAIASNMLNEQRTGSYNDGEFTRHIIQNFFKYTGLHQLTEAQRVASVESGQFMMRQLAADVAKRGNKQKSAEFFMQDLGIPHEEALGFANWIQNFTDGKPTRADLQNDGRYQELYKTALQRHVDRTIMNPNASMKPYLSKYPIVSLAYNLQSFVYAFSKNVLIRNARLTREATKGGYTVADRIALVKPAIMMTIPFLLAGAIGELRDELFKDPSAKPKDKDKWSILARFASRFQPWGAFDPYVNMVTSIRYQKDPATALVGPLGGSISTLFKAAVSYYNRNSDKTNTAERNLAKALYSVAIQPTFNALASLSPVPLAGAAAIQAISHPATREKFISEIAGEKEEKGSGARSPRASHRSSGRHNTRKTSR